MTYDLDHALNCQVLSLHQRQEHLLSGCVVRRNSLGYKPKPIKGLLKPQLKQELTSLGIYEGSTRTDFRTLLTEEMHGIQRVSALLFNTPEAELENLGLSTYEILPNEPPHDVGHHIQNVFDEFPKHLSAPERQF